jgi:hypothetical protein
MENIQHLKKRKALLVDTLNELVEEWHATDTSLAIFLWIYRQKLAKIRKGWKTSPEDVENYLSLLNL